MPTDVRIIHQAGFVRARLDGTFDADTGKHLLEQVSKVSGSLGPCEVFIDVRDVTGSLVGDQLATFAVSLAQRRNAPIHKTAILCAPEHFDRCKLLAHLANAQGGTTKAFLAYEDAVEWLICVTET